MAVKIVEVEPGEYVYNILKTQIAPFYGVSVEKFIEHIVVAMVIEPIIHPETAIEAAEKMADNEYMQRLGRGTIKKCGNS